MKAQGRPGAQQRSLVGKGTSYRVAEVLGSVDLSPRGRRAIRQGKVEKGDPLTAAPLAGLAAMKRTAELIPYCHIVPLLHSQVDAVLTGRGVTVTARAEAEWSTGVEMEALVGATVALLTVWDMVKYLEKDGRGLYPNARIDGVRVVAKVKSRTAGARA